MGRSWENYIDSRAVNKYLTLIGEKELPLNLFEIIDIEDRFPVERVNKHFNARIKFQFNNFISIYTKQLVL